MSKIRTLVIDDEKHFISTMNTLLEGVSDVKVIGTARSVEEGLIQIDVLEPDLVFLDVEMEDGTGFDLLKQIDRRDFRVVFVTAYDHYAVEAFRFSAVDYLLKPIDPDELLAAVERAKARKIAREKKKVASNPNLKVLLENLAGEKEEAKLFIPDQHGFVVVNVKEIIRLEADRNYTTFVLDDGRKIVASKNIKYFEELLEGQNFFRIHQTHVVNLDHIEKYIRGRGGSVITSDGAELEVSRRKRDEFISKLTGKND